MVLSINEEIVLMEYFHLDVFYQHYQILEKLSILKITELVKLAKHNKLKQSALINSRIKMYLTSI